MTSQGAREEAPGTSLPRWGSVLVVVAHPDDESFGLGAVLSVFADAGASLSVLCLTGGEASTLGAAESDLAAVRAAELGAAADRLGVHRVTLRDHADGALSRVRLEALVQEVVDEARAVGAEGVLGFDLSGVTGHPDHARATEAAAVASRQLGLGMLGWTVPDEVATVLRAEFGAAFTGHPPEAIDVELPVSRERQLEAVACHPSQAVPGSVLWRRLELLGDREHLRWLAPER